MQPTMAFFSVKLLQRAKVAFTESQLGKLLMVPTHSDGLIGLCASVTENNTNAMERQIFENIFVATAGWTS
jgi:hypothetical protein